MQTPNKISGQEFLNQKDAYYTESCIKGKEGYLCRACDTSIHYVAACVSLHNSPFQDICAGWGEVFYATIPYCPKCEEPPADSGCLHPEPIPTISAAADGTSA